ncbi:MAG: Gmad2 immunoglobulin-like domain-containing protein [Caldilineaceae bacterium]
MKIRFGARKAKVAVLVIAIVCTIGFGQASGVNAASFSAPMAQNDEEFTFYTVQPGDTLAAIAQRYSVSLELLMQVNNIANPDLIFVGQQLRIPTATEPATPIPTSTSLPIATPLPSTTVTSTSTATPNPKVTKSPTPTATATFTPSPTPSPAAPGNSVWRPAEQAIELLSPVADAVYHSPIEVIGYSRTFEGNVVIRLSDTQGNILGTRNAQGGSVDGYAFFHNSLRFEVTTDTPATLELFEVSAKDGTEINKAQIPIVLRAGQRRIDLTKPLIGQAVCMPVRIEGYSNTFEANVNVELGPRSGEVVLASGNATGGSLGNFAEFTTELNLDVQAALPMLVGAYELDAQDGRQVDHTRLPISLYPSSSKQCR